MLSDKNRPELEDLINELNKSEAKLSAEIIELEDIMADDQLKLALLEDSTNREYQAMREFYVRRLVRNRRKLEELKRQGARLGEELRVAKERTRTAPSDVVAAH